MPNNKKRLSHKHVFATTKKMQKDTILTVVVNMIRYIFVIVGEIPTISQVYQYIHVWFVIPAHFCDPCGGHCMAVGQNPGKHTKIAWTYACYASSPPKKW